MAGSGFSDWGYGLFVKVNAPPQPCTGSDVSCASVQLVSTTPGGCTTGAWVMAYLASADGKLVQPLAATSPPLPEGKPVDIYIGAPTAPPQGAVGYTFQLGPIACSHER